MNTSPTPNFSHGLSAAVEQNDMQALNAWLAVAQVGDGNLAALWAVRYNRPEHLIAVLPVCSDRVAALKLALFENKPECAELLFEHLTQRQLNSVLIECVMEHRVEAVKMIVPHANPKARNSEALRLAALYSTASAKEIVRVLLPLSNARVVLDKLEHIQSTNGSVEVVREYVLQREQNKRIRTEIPQRSKTHKQRKI